uniref:C2H2-type domain-containing protein n=1 Tax=Gasterosteus aculeatus aculeatus TaxID=481459 RepID=G3PR27_GASAC
MGSPSLPLSALRLLVPPIRLVSAAIWQTVEQKIVSDYGLLEEFVYMVTEMVPQLLSTRQRAELILGLRAREKTYVVFHDTLLFAQSLRSVLLLFSPVSQDVFPGDFGPTYDKAIQTLMWLFLSRLEKLLPTQTLQQVDFNIQSYFYFSALFNGILSALCLPPVERVLIVSDQAESGLMYTVCTEMEVESENKGAYPEGAEHSGEGAQAKWRGVKAETDAVVVTDPAEGHRCPNQAKAKPGRKAKEQEAAADEGEQSSGEAAAGGRRPDADGDPDGEASLEGSSKESGQKSPEEKSLLEGPFYCPHCSQQVDPEQPEDVKHCFRCDECDKAFKYKSTLESHKQTHNPLYCEVCTKLVRDPEALAMHKESHTPFQCNRCEENFPVFKALHKHYIDVHDPVEPFTCTHCLTTFASLKRFIRHEWKHTGYQPFQCPHCSKRFRSYSDLVEHQKKHTKAYPFLCWECGKKFRHGVTLTRHVERVHHSGEPVSEKPVPTFTCAQCGKTFTSRRCLLKHDNFHHKGLRFPCEFCGKGFFGKDALVRHTLIHTGERPFKCDDCDKSFRSAAELKIHRRYHTGERPFKCNVCQKGFVQSCFLTLHMRTHTGERPYVCTVCSKGFSSLHGLKRHRRLVHA